MGLSKKEYLERQVAQQRLMEELDRVMPKIPGWRSAFEYECRICGSIARDRLKHLRWHRGSDIVDVLTRLFGRPN